MSTITAQLGNNSAYRFFVLILLVLVTGFSQGMLLPLLAIMLEQAGIASTYNGLNAAGLYIGILLISPFIEKPVRKYGYKPVITVGLMLIVISLILLPIWQMFWLWFVLRMLVGIGDNAVHFATQVWITSASPPAKRGRNISIYGISFSLGFTFGPVMTRLLTINEYLPFFIAAFFTFLSWFFIIQLKNEFPKGDNQTTAKNSTWIRYKQVLKLGWFALLPGFCYGYLESSIHGNFPVYAIRQGITVDWVSILLPAFVIGGILTQLPIGLLSDKIGRKRVLLIVTLLGSLTFLTIPLIEHNNFLLMIFFVISGSLIGSLYSLGIIYLADILPGRLLATGNVLTAISFGLGSMIGPLIGGALIDLIGKGSIFYSVGGILLIVFTLGTLFNPNNKIQVDKELSA